jgi:hypothetical protein
MDKPRQYSKTEITSMKYSGIWNNCLVESNTVTNKNSNGLFELHATGDCDLDGRKYVSLPVGTQITPAIKKEYNII